MRKTWKKVLALVCAAAMVVTSFSPALQTQAAENPTNVALNKSAKVGFAAETTVTDPTNSQSPASKGVDGNKSSAGQFAAWNDSYENLADDVRPSVYFEVDLGQLYDLSSAKMWRYWDDGRTYKETMIIASKDANFDAGEDDTVIYNAASEAYSYGYGAGTDETYAETSSGHEFAVAEGTQAQYVRVYMRGNSNPSNPNHAGNHLVELEVYGTVPVVEADKTALEAAIAAAAEYVEEDYTAESWAVLAAALTAADELAEDADQTAVDAAAKAITDAIAALVVKPEEPDVPVEPEKPVLVEVDSTVLAANAMSNSEQNPAQGNDGPATYAFNEEQTWWHSRWGGTPAEHETTDGRPSADNPIWIQTGFGEKLNVAEITYLARYTRQGVIKDYTVSVANLEDAAAVPTTEDFEVVKTGTLACTTDKQTITLDEAVEATHIRITVTSVYSGYDTDGTDLGNGFVQAQNIKVYVVEVEEEPDVPAVPDEPTIEVSERVQGIIDGMSIRDKVTQMLMVDFRKWTESDAAATDFTVMNDQVRKIVEDYNFGSVIYFANNIKETEQSFNLTQEMQAAATKDGGIALLIAADQEGGSVYRLGSGTALPGNMALGATFDTENSYKAGKIIGSELSAIGINTNLAPVVDVNNNANNPVIGLRSYGDDATAVGEMAAASIKGMAEYNVIGTAKHFPGHGDTATDSHYGLPIVDKSYDVLKEVELKPYEVAIEEGIEMIMTAHILYPQLESDKIVSKKTGEAESLPATMSDDILTGLLKGDMGFDGIIVTDAMNMAGISAKWDQVQSVVIAFQAGVDMICMPCQLYSQADLANLDAIIDGVVAAVEAEEIPMSRIDDAVGRILTVKENRGILDYKAEDFTLEKANATVGSDENRQTEREIAAAAVTVVKNENNVLPLDIKADSKVLMLVPYNNESAQMVMAWNRAIEAGIIPYGAEVDYYRFNNATFNDTLKAKVDWADYVIINSEISSTSSGRMKYGHWLSALPNTVVDYCKENGKVSVISSVDKPYDVQLYPNADAIVAAYGCKGSSADPTESLIGGATGSAAAYGPNIIAAVEVALGTYGAQGKLPVNIPVYDAEANTYTETIAFERGYGLTYEAKEAIAVDKANLETTIIDNSYIDISEATEETAAVYTEALAAAKAVLADEAATMYEVEETMTALLDAVAGLKTVGIEAVANDILVANAYANSEQLPEQYVNDGGAAWAFDGNEEHWWHQRYDSTGAKYGKFELDADGNQVVSGKLPSETTEGVTPVWIQTGFGESKTVKAVTYASRTGGSGANRAKDYYVAVANLEDPAQLPADEDFTVVATGTFANTDTLQTVTLETPAEATHVRMYFTSVYDVWGVGEDYVTARRIDVYVAGGEAELEIKVDKSELQALTDECAAIDTSIYTEETAAALAAALTAAQTVLDNAEATSADVYAAIEALTAAKDALKVFVDKSELTAAIAAAEALNAEDYVDFAAVEEAIAAAKAVEADEKATKEAVDAAKEALAVAVAALEEKPAGSVVDPTDDSLDVPVEMYTATAGSTQPGNSPDIALDGDPSSFWEVVWDIGAEDPSALWYQITLDDVVEVQAVRYLPRWGGNAGNINGFIESYYITVSEDGSEWKTVAEGTWEMSEGWKIAQFDAPVMAKYIRLVATATYADVDSNFGNADEVSSNMSIAEIRVKATGEVINKGALKAAIAEAEGLVAEDYVDISGIAAPLAAAKEVVGNTEATQEEVDAAAAALNAALDALVKVVKKDALKAAIADAKEVDQSLYTSTTAKALADAIAAGEALVDDETATQEAVDAAVTAITKAKAALKAKATAEEKAALQEAVDAAEAMDTTGYTEESVAELADAIAAAKEILADADATSKDVKNAADDIQDAIDALEIPVVEDEVVRLYGASRYDTGYAVADAFKEALGVDKFEAVVVATGKNFADALAGSYLAVEKNAPILLTNGNDDNVATLHEYIAANVEEGGKVYILGGTGAVPATVEAIEGYDVVRLSGPSRYDTNLEILKEAGIAGDSIIVATGKTFADSLSASAAKLPILLVKPNAALNDAQKEILAGMKNIYIVGGEGAVSADYEAELKAFGEVTRVSGKSRYETSVEIAKTFCSDVEFAVVASGKNFPDGLCGGPLAAVLGAPLVLTRDGGAEAAAGYVAENGIASGYVLGGSGALADETVVEVFALESVDEIK